MALIHGKKIKIFALNSNKELAQEIADNIGVPLSECTVNRFSDGEVQVNVNETVRGHEVFVVQTNKTILSSKSLFYKTENFIKQTKNISNIDSLISKFLNFAKVLT